MELSSDRVLADLSAVAEVFVRAIHRDTRLSLLVERPPTPIQIHSRLGCVICGQLIMLFCFDGALLSVTTWIICDIWYAMRYVMKRKCACCNLRSSQLLKYMKCAIDAVFMLV